MPASPPTASAPARLLFVCGHPELGGAEMCMVRILEGLQRAGHQLLVACPGPDELSSHLSQRGLPVELAPLEHFRFSPDPATLAPRLASLRRQAAYLTGLARRFEPQLVVANGYRVGLAAGLAARRLSLPVLWHVRDIPSSAGRGHLIRAAAARYCDLAVVPSQATAQAMGPSRCLVIPDGVDPAAWVPSRSRDQVRAELGLSPRHVVLGNVGGLRPEKGQDLLLQAFAHLLPRHPDWRLVLVGGMVPADQTSYDPALFLEVLEGLGKDLARQGKVIFTGHRQDVADLYATFDLYVHASPHPDPMPGVVMEAMALGLAVLAPDGGGCPEEVEDGQTGLLFRPGDWRDLAAKLELALEQPQSLARMGQAGRQRLERLFLLEQTLTRVRALYQDRALPPRLAA